VTRQVSAEHSWVFETEMQDLDEKLRIAMIDMREGCRLGGRLRDAADGTSGALERE